jgi:hypothetical protein
MIAKTRNRIRVTDTMLTATIISHLLIYSGYKDAV